MKWTTDKNGLYVTNCSFCNEERRTVNRPYNSKYCRKCNPSQFGNGQVRSYTPERNKKISEVQKLSWKNGRSNTHLDEWRNSEKNKKRLRSQQKKATKAVLGIKQSKPEKGYEKELRKQGIEYKTQNFVEQYPFDFYIPSKNLLVEIDGEFYHPLKEEDCVYPIQKHNFKRDKLKTIVAMNNGYKLKRVRV